MCPLGGDYEHTVRAVCAVQRFYAVRCTPMSALLAGQHGVLLLQRVQLLLVVIFVHLCGYMRQ
jgi:hypothetical protein